MKITDPRFKYTPAMKTNIEATWKKYGYKPTTDADRHARQKRAQEKLPDNVRQIDKKVRSK